MLYGYGSVEETEEGNVTAVFIDTIKYNEQRLQIMESGITVNPYRRPR